MRPPAHHPGALARTARLLLLTLLASAVVGVLADVALDALGAHHEHDGAGVLTHVGLSTVAAAAIAALGALLALAALRLGDGAAGPALPIVPGAAPTAARHAGRSARPAPPSARPPGRAPPLRAG
ncbi:hypothetical protein SK069_11325 [Patulibacter brassicae]|uniref:Uncharacterized protein n=1 Tax=Patulibacter brassicae TaxID=1705717 RepID=A0ABU4VK47_9ACTN|nr:hypothetical protein [Patulibacter brassicae]MDX8152188.1 hypothetical protein [Patulibacter brassicae]